MASVGTATVQAPVRGNVQSTGTRRQLLVGGVLLLTYALLALLIYLTVPLDQISPIPGAKMPDIPGWQLGLANAGLILVGYGLLGLAGFWCTRRLGLPGIFRAGAGWRAWVGVPLVLGLGMGVLLIAGDRIFALLGQMPGFPHPTFPLAVYASASAGIGEELLFRLFVLGFWAFLLNLVLRRWQATPLACWIAVGIAALAFGAAHLPAAMLLYNVASPADLPPLVIVEIFVLNGLLGVVAGARFLRDGLVAAVGVHFWADIVWHVVWPLLAL